ncbi:hypothetical protein E1262_28290 [Jiangella aurantiaca]|uniref:HupE/UreJ family protein n=1 Tax=Jiangella aurantiaca TaxID=2530373 RepID=A0A4R5A0K2_9ACTN|nr:HupE/UreJ family protein [Jiangella aurantiaca]TDD64400.1 hypothetical protein E1262_28290 [Jiangella aurantiaca]
MTVGLGRRLCRALAAAAVVITALLLAPAAAQAHSLDSSTISVHVTDDGVDATVTVALEAVDDALGTDYAGEQEVSSYSGALIDYLADHLEVTAADGTVWGESFANAARETVDGIDSFSVVVTFDTGSSDTSEFVIEYDAIIEAIPAHEAVVVLTGIDGEVSTAGVITGADPTLAIGTPAGSATPAGLLDMVEYGFHHVLEGADHLLFLATLLLTAPAVVIAGRWTRRIAVVPTLHDLTVTITSFTAGHSITLIAASLGWVAAPTMFVEVLVAVSVGVAAVHVIRPLARRGEALIAAGFGLVHGLAFAGILTGLGLEGSTSVAALLAFNVGVELAQLAAAALIFPPLYLLACTRYYRTAQIAGASIALTAATGWVLERLGVLANPLAGLESAAIAHPWHVVIGLTVVAVAGWALHRRSEQSRLAVVGR